MWYNGNVEKYKALGGAFAGGFTYARKAVNHMDTCNSVNTTDNRANERRREYVLMVDRTTCGDCIKRMLAMGRIQRMLYADERAGLMRCRNCEKLMGKG